MAEHGKMGPPDYDESRYSWEIYKKEVQIWAELTKLDDEKKGSAFWMTLTGKAKSVVQDMTIEEIKGKDGLTKMLAKLEDVFKPDANQAAYMAYQEFEMFKRPDEMKLPDFVIKFEELNSRIKVRKMVLLFFALSMIQQCIFFNFIHVHHSPNWMNYLTSKKLKTIN